MKLIYVAHKFGGDLRNADRAERLTAELNLRIDGAIFVCPWLPMVRHWPNHGATLARGMQLDLESVRRCDGLIALTPLLTGVKAEWDACENSKCYFDSWGWDIGETWPDENRIQAWIDGIGAF